MEWQWYPTSVGGNAYTNKVVPHLSEMARAVPSPADLFLLGNSFPYPRCHNNLPAHCLSSNFLLGNPIQSPCLAFPATGRMKRMLENMFLWFSSISKFKYTPKGNFVRQHASSSLTVVMSPSDKVCMRPFVAYVWFCTVWGYLTIRAVHLGAFRHCWMRMHVCATVCDCNCRHLNVYLFTTPQEYPDRKA